jgi:cobaltochelatase CobN
MMKKWRTAAAGCSFQKAGEGACSTFPRDFHGNLQAIRAFFQVDGRSLIDALVYFQWFQLTTFSDEDPGETVRNLKDLNVPVFDAAPLYGRCIEAWRETDQGFSPVETLTAVILPELDGMIEPLPTASLEEQEAPGFGGRVKRVAPIADRVERLAARLAAWIRLRRLANQDKKVAFIIYDYPPGEDNLGSAAYLDVFASLQKLLQILRDEGYQVRDIPEVADFPERFLSQGLINDARWGGEGRSLTAGQAVTPEVYGQWLAGLPAAPEITQTWGEPPGNLMVEQGQFLIPALEFGNVLVGVQPARGYHHDPDKISHDKTLPPHHQYVALYRWLEEAWRPDVMVHVGTHGTLEFLKGKEVGLSRTCWPEILLGNVPHLYIYHAVNASEATIAKRRSLAVLVNYNSPSFAASGLYDDYAVLDDRIAEYYEAQGLDPGRAERLARTIREQAQALNLAATAVEEIQEELVLMKRAIIPKGLHVLGNEPDLEEKIDFATLLLRYDRGPTPSLHRLPVMRAADWGFLGSASLMVLLAAVQTPEPVFEQVVDLTTSLTRDGHRPDIVLLKAARALASLRSKAAVTPEDLREVLHLALNHRLKRLPFEDVSAARGKLAQLRADFFPPQPQENQGISTD